MFWTVATRKLEIGLVFSGGVKDLCAEQLVEATSADLTRHRVAGCL